MSGGLGPSVRPGLERRGLTLVLSQRDRGIRPGGSSPVWGLSQDWAAFEYSALQCLAVPIGGLLEFLWLGTALTAWQVCWSAVILAGVIIAVVPERVEMDRARQWGMGVIMGTIAAVGQGGGAVITRKAYGVCEALGTSVDGGTAAYHASWVGSC